MTELSREHIESVRVLAQHYDGTPVELFGVSVRALCDMALRTHDAEADRDNYRAKFHDAEQRARLYARDGDRAWQRAQRAEAECERLREAATYWMHRAQNDERELDGLKAEMDRTGFALRWLYDASQMAADTAITQDAELPRARKNAGKVLVTPPPENEPDDRVEAAYWDGRSDERKRWEPQGTPHAPEQGGKCIMCDGTGNHYRRQPEGVIGYAPCQRCNGTGKPQPLLGVVEHTPQAHGDALAALEALADVAWNNVESHENRYVIHHSYDLVRQALTASGVPYVPEEVRRLPEQWRRNPPRNAQDCAYDLESVLASAPAVPNIPESVVDEIVDEFEWMAEDEDGRDASHTPADWERLMLKDFAMLLLSEAPNRIAAAPQRGGGEIKRDERRWFGRDGSKWEGE